MISKSHYVSIFDKSPAFAFGVAQYIEQSNSGYVAVAASSYQGFERNCRVLGRPTLIVIDESLIQEAGEFSYLKSLLASSSVRWLVTERREKSDSAMRSENVKVHGFVRANLPLKELLDAINGLLPEQGLNATSFFCADNVPVGELATQTKKAIFTPRQDEVYSLVLRGCSNKEIARSLGISESTVKEHITGILEKLGLKTRIEALSRALRSTP